VGYVEMCRQNFVYLTPTKKGFDVVHTGRMHFWRTCLIAGIIQSHPKIFKEETIAQSRFHTDIGGNPDKHQIANPASA
jgi:hypothetical protein